MLFQEQNSWRPGKWMNEQDFHFQFLDGAGGQFLLYGFRTFFHLLSHEKQ